MAAEYDHLPVYKAAYDLLQHVYRDKCIASVPRDVKYTLVERLKQDILEVLVLIYKAHYNMLGDKALQLQQARELIPGVKARMRIMYDLRYINLELFRTLAVEVESVSKQLGAWHTKTLRRRIVAPPAPAPARTAAPAAAPVAAPASVAPTDPFAAPAPAATRPAPAPRSARTDLFAAPAPAAAPPFPAPDPSASPGPRGPLGGPGRRQRMMCKHDAKLSQSRQDRSSVEVKRLRKSIL